MCAGGIVRLCAEKLVSCALPCCYPQSVDELSSRLIAEDCSVHTGLLAMSENQYQTVSVTFDLAHPHAHDALGEIMGSPKMLRGLEEPGIELLTCGS